MTKSEIREKAIAARKSITDADRKTFDRLIFERGHKIRSFLLAESVHIYRSTPQEVDTSSFFEYAFALNKRVYSPMSARPDVPQFVRVDRDTTWQPGRLGIMEPVVGSDVESNNELNLSTVVIVPLVAFSPQLTRVGYGKGYYDRLLENFQGVTIGLAYECQKVPEIIADVHDVALKYVVTERHMYRNTTNP
jgi:5-formyltetrahydrofolate cyclo-ligase